jgi:hypothetical protein
MTGGTELLRQAREAGLHVEPRPGGRLTIRGPKLAEPVALLLLAHKPAVLAALAADWRARHREALAWWGALRPTADASRLARGQLENRWHRLHGRRTPEWQCAGCGEPIGGLPALNLADGNRVHLDKLDCLFSFGQRWRTEATAALQPLGLDPPADGDP